MKNITVSKITKVAIVAAVYAVLTAVIAPISYGPIQFRISEIMTLLAFIDPLYIPGLVLGCAISNLFSPLGIVDVVVGTTATFISVYMISKSKNLFIASLWPTINCIFIGAELYYLQHLPFWLTSLEVAIGEFVVVTLIGYPIFRVLLKKGDIIKLLKVSN
ncbi:membrane protein [Clostridium novyi A str. NCTC 538]|nr:MULTISPECIES: QueT transporter family protein [Clostridium]KEH85830.1 membrane protein [Clostridium novyi A str. NCTC 538]KEH87104.1 membrane protein [Clostridium novyi A str. 4540]KEH92524.1 membrane protein [Clostridium novyi A str. GD211209]